MASLVVADDHPLMLDAVCRLFDGGDTAILDVHMPYLSGLQILAEARADRWRSKIILLTAGLEPDPIVEALRLKVDGLILKGAAADTLVRAAGDVLAGQQWIDKDAMQQALGLLTSPAADQNPAAALTPREADVVRGVAQGRRNKEIARDLGITEGTVKMHLHNLYEKLSVGSRTELLILTRDWDLG